MAIRTLSLFAGCGGLDLAIGLATGSHRPVCYVENEVTAARILAARFADGSLAPAPIWSDIRSFDGTAWRGAVDLIIGGFPCTDLSVAGKQAGIAEGTRSGLWFEYLRIIREVQPRWVAIENVPPVLAYPAGGIVLGGLAGLGFDAEWGTLRASDVGAPHQRKRVFVLAYRQIRGCGVRGESSWRDGQLDGRDEGLENTEYTRPPCTGAAVQPPATADDIGGSGATADPGIGFLPQPRRGSEGRDGAGSAGTDDVAHAINRRRQDGRAEGACSLRDARDADNGSEATQPGGTLPDASAAGLPQPECETVLGAGRRDEGRATGELHLPLFPPGPADRDAWRELLAEYPWLAPAVESGVRVHVDGVAVVVDASRADQLRAGGNGVVAVQGAAMFVELARRAGIAGELGIGGGYELGNTEYADGRS